MALPSVQDARREPGIYVAPSRLDLAKSLAPDLPVYADERLFDDDWYVITAETITKSQHDELCSLMACKPV